MPSSKQNENATIKLLDIIRGKKPEKDDSIEFLSSIKKEDKIAGKKGAKKNRKNELVEMEIQTSDVSDDISPAGGNSESNQQETKAKPPDKHILDFLFGDTAIETDSKEETPELIEDEDSEMKLGFVDGDIFSQDEEKEVSVDEDPHELVFQETGEKQEVESPEADESNDIEGDEKNGESEAKESDNPMDLLFDDLLGDEQNELENHESSQTEVVKEDISLDLEGAEEIANAEPQRPQETIEDLAVTESDTEDALDNADLFKLDESKEAPLTDLAEEEEKDQLESDDEGMHFDILTDEDDNQPVTDEIVEETKSEETEKSSSEIDEEEIVLQEDLDTVGESDELEEEDFEEFDVEDSGPVAFHYKKEKKFSLQFLSSLLKGPSGRVGLDIGSYSIKMIYIGVSGGVITVQDFKYVTIPLDIRENPEKREKFIKSTVKDIFSDKNIKKAKLNLLLSGTDIGIKNIQMPKVGKKELDEAVRWSTRKHLSFSADDALIDFKVIQDVIVDGIPKLDILVIAALDKLVDEKLEQLSKLKIPAKVIPIPLAMWQFYIKHYPTDVYNNVMILDIGHNSTMINVINDRNLRFAREIGISGKDFTESLVGNLSTDAGDRVLVDEEMAERLKETYGLPSREHENRKTEEKIPLSQLASRLRSPLERIGNEIQRSIRYYKNEFAFGDINVVYLAGGSSAMLNIDTFLEDYLGLKVEVCNPMNLWNMGHSISDIKKLESSAISLSVPAGISLDTASELNLLPEKLAQIAQNTVFKFTVKLIGIVTLVTALGMSTIAAINTNSKKQESEELAMQVANLSPRAKEYNTIQKSKKDIAKKVTDIKAMQRKPSIKIDIFKIISNLMPENVSLNSIKITEPRKSPPKAQVRFAGYITVEQYNSQAKLAQFLFHLENSGFMNNINLVSSANFSDKNVAGLSFIIESEVVNREN